MSEANAMLESVYQLTQNSVTPSDSTLGDSWLSLRSICEIVEPLVHGGGDGTFRAPQLIVMGQPKCGKSSLINEMLGQTIVSQSQGPNESPHEIRKLRYSPNLYELRSDNQSCEPVVAVEMGLPNNLLQRIGFEVVDSTGSADSPPVTTWNLGTSGGSSVIIYVIDAVEEISTEVEEDVQQVLLGCPGTHLIFVLNKMDAACATPDAEEDRSVALRHRVLSKLRSLGCPSEGSEDSPINFFFLSCRRLKAIRRRNGEFETKNGLDDIWTKEMERLRQTLLGYIGLRLKQRLLNLLPRLEEANKVFGERAVKCGDLRESKKHAWKTILELTKRISKSIQQAAGGDNTIALAEQMRMQLKTRKMEILEAVKNLEMKEPAQQQQNWAEAEIERKVRDLQRQWCQECADAELTDRLTTTDDVIAKLTDFQAVYFDAPLAPSVDKKFIVELEFEKLTGPSEPRQGLTRRFSSNRGEFFRSRSSRQPAAWTDQKWRMDTATKVTSTTQLRPMFKQSAERLNTLVHVAQTDTVKAVERAADQVDAFLTGLKNRKKSLRKNSLVCLKLWLRLQSVLSESICRKLLQQNLCCIAVGSQGNPVFAEKRLRLEGGKALVVKKLYLDDEQLSAMAAALHYSCTSTRDFVLRTEHLQLKKLNAKPKLWKLLIWTERMSQSLQQQLNELCNTLSMTDRLRISLSIAEAVAQMHLDCQPHFNLQMSNIFVASDNRTVRLADIGQSRLIRLLLHSRQTFSTAVFPPELLPLPTKSATVGQVRSVNYARVDTFSLGAVLKALVFGGEIPPPFEDVDDDLGVLIDECIQSSPSQRPTPADVAERLRKMLDKEPKKDS